MGAGLMGGFVCPSGVGTRLRLGTGEGCADSDGRELGKFSCVGPGLADGFADSDGCWVTGLAVRRVGLGVGLGVGADPPPPVFVGAGVGGGPDFPPFPDCNTPSTCSNKHHFCVRLRF